MESIIRYADACSTFMDAGLFEDQPTTGRIDDKTTFPMNHLAMQFLPRSAEVNKKETEHIRQIFHNAMVLMRSSLPRGITNVWFVVKDFERKMESKITHPVAPPHRHIFFSGCSKFIEVQETDTDWNGRDKLKTHKFARRLQRDHDRQARSTAHGGSILTPVSYGVLAIEKRPDGERQNSKRCSQRLTLLERVGIVAAPPSHNG